MPKAASKRKVKTKNSWALLYALTSFAVVIIVWNLATAYTSFGSIFPTPWAVAKLFLLSLHEPIGQHTIIIHLLFSLYRVIVGFSIGATLGTVTGLLMGTSKTADAIIRPIFDVARPIPAIAWLPLAILWFGIGAASKFFIIGLASFVVCTLNSYAGAKRVDPVLVGAARMLGASDRQIFTKIVLPSSIPQVFAGLQIAITGAWSVVLVAEMVRATEGAGWIIITGMNTGNITRILVGLIAIGITGMLLATLMRLIERRALAWNSR
ncbi:MAG: ABC transporter permease [Clostridiales bacterium]|nr:ABC transporter permease [Clostridiales bacterium]